MMKSTTIALVIAFATFSAPAAMARSHGGHSHHTSPHVTKTVDDYGYARTDPIRRTWGSECVTDEGQGRFFPCDGLP
jgi:hypothetical protein